MAMNFTAVGSGGVQMNNPSSFGGSFAMNNTMAASGKGDTLAWEANLSQD